MKDLREMCDGKLSRLIRLAIADLERAERTPGVRIRMNIWLVWELGSCSVCLAGAVMIGTLGVTEASRDGYGLCQVTLSSFGNQNRYALRALDYLRQGNIRRALWVIAGEPTPLSMFTNFQTPRGVPDTFEVTPYENDPAQFKLDMLRLADLLEQKLDKPRRTRTRVPRSSRSSGRVGAATCPETLELGRSESRPSRPDRPDPCAATPTVA